MFLWYPKCSTCKRVKDTLEKEGYTLYLRDIKEENPTKEELQTWTTEENIDHFFNTSGILYKEMHLKEKRSEMSYLEKIELLSKNGMLVKRPIWVLENQILVGGREIENYIKRSSK